MTRYVLGFDIGGSGGRGGLARLDLDGPHPIASTVTDRPMRVDHRGLIVEHLVEIIGQMADQLLDSQHDGVAAIAIGCTGLTHQGELVRAELPAWLADRYRPELVVLSSDTLTAYLGGLGRQPGAVIAAGTGAVAVGTDMRGQWRRVDGWGYNVGDAGGGSWIGRQGLDAALRASDGRTGASPALLDRLLARYGSPVSLAGQLARRDDRASVLAGFAPEVLDAAAQGETRAVGIVVEAGGHLADSVLAALLPGCDRVTAVGSLVTANRMLSDAFADSVRRSRPGANVAEPLGTGGDGALRLAAAALSDELPAGSDTLGAWVTRFG